MAGQLRYRTAAALGLAIAIVGCTDGAREERRRAAGTDQSLQALMRVADPVAGAAAFGRCRACHTVERGAGDRNGPNLFGVIGAPIAGSSLRYGYTDALQKVGGHWTRVRMNAWLADPQRAVPGTSMRFAGIFDPLERADIIAFLETQQ